MFTYFLILFVIKCVLSKDYIFERFDDGDAWEKRWIQSNHKSDFGKFILTAGKFFADPHFNKGIQTSENARFYALARKFDSNEVFNNKDKTLVIQFIVKHEQDIDCGGGYIKLIPCSDEVKLEDFHGETPYKVMFGPDICGYSTKKVHAIINYKNKNHLIKKEVRCKDDVFSHVYTFILKPDNTYEILVDNEKVESGNLEDDWEFLLPKKIPDPHAKKPDDWDEREKIDDASDKKPEDWDKPETIRDPEAKKPEDWDDEMDGEWEPPMIDNPEYKGEWKPRQIDNPDYKGIWVHPEIDNPDYEPDSGLYNIGDVCAVGFDLWQVKAGTIFDDILVTDDVESARKIAEEYLNQTKDAEKKMKDQQDEEERKKQEEESKSTEKTGTEETEDEEEEDKDVEKDNLEDTEGVKSHEEL